MHQSDALETMYNLLNEPIDDFTLWKNCTGPSASI